MLVDNLDTGSASLSDSKSDGSVASVLSCIVVTDEEGSRVGLGIASTAALLGRSRLLGRGTSTSELGEMTKSTNERDMDLSSCTVGDHKNFPPLAKGFSSSAYSCFGCSSFSLGTITL